MRGLASNPIIAIGGLRVPTRHPLFGSPIHPISAREQKELIAPEMANQGNSRNIIPLIAQQMNSKCKLRHFEV